MSNIELVEIKLSKKDLDCISEEEAVFFLQFGGLIHEVISLQKFIYMSSHGSSNAIQRMAENAQSMYFYRLLAGTIFEGWSLLMQNRFRVVLGKYKPDLDDQASSALKTLEKYFSKGNLCEDIRNNFVYHYNYGKIRNMLRQWPDKDQLEIYFSEYHGNCRYAASDAITNMAMLGINNIDELPAKLQRLVEEIPEIAQLFIDLISEYLSKIIIKIVETKNIPSSQINLSGVPTLDEVRLHYFIAKQ